MKLAEIQAGMPLVGLEPNLVCSVIATVNISESALQVIYKRPDGGIKERLLTNADESTIAVATVERPWAFDGDPTLFQLTCEAKRIHFAFLFDPMMAVHSSNVEPLPHQITAVYESLLPRQPLRYVLADDPGAGKTIMAGLYIRELIMRADARRVLIVAPGSLVEQWRDELRDKFGLEFRIYSAALEEATPSGNPFEDHNQLIVRLDQLARDEEGDTGERIAGRLQSKLCSAGWDLVVFDEAHKLAAHFYGTKLEKTGRYRFAERLARETRHLLLMTATPHNGKEESFQLFLALLDSDRFYGKFRNGVHKADTNDLMRRMVKEELVKFDGTPLFPERRAYTVNYKLSKAEQELYEQVTHYVQTEMGKADELTGQRRTSVGFALTSLQRRLASSPEAIYQSLKRRKERLSDRLREAKVGGRAKTLLAETVDTVPEDEDELNAEEQESLEEKLVDRATAAKTIVELEVEIGILANLEAQAKAVVSSGQDRKWDELSQLLQHNPETRDSSGKQRKIIIFSEHRDTLNYLQAKIDSLLGLHQKVVTIHGGTHRDERQKIQALFRSDTDVRVLIATDAAGEGVNLQCAHLMVNYDLPWNPNRLEQRFGRIHRIGQTEVCHLWSLVAKETREGEVWHRLLAKIETECKALNGKVFNILGEAFEEESLKDLLVEAIRYGDSPDVRAKLTQKVDSVFTHEHLLSLLNRNALAHETMSAERLFKVKEEMEKAEARKLQPFYVRSFFQKALESLGGSMHRREAERWEITHIPATIRDRKNAGRNRREQEPILKRYERVAFSRDAIQPVDRPGLLRAVLMHPGHPLMLAVTDLILEQNANLLRRGAVFLDPTDETDQPWLLFLLTHAIQGGDDVILSQRMQFIRVNPDGTATHAGAAPHLDLQPLPNWQTDNLRSLAKPDHPLRELLNSAWINAEQEQRAVAYAASTLVPEHYQEVAQRRLEHVDRTLHAVNERLRTEIDYWTEREIALREDARNGKDVQLPLSHAERLVRELASRLETRRAELLAMREVRSGTPVTSGGALVVPIGLLRKLHGETTPQNSADAAARKRIETLAMNAVIRAEQARGHRVVDVSAHKCGWDISSYPPSQNNIQPDPIHIEVKGRVKGAETITVTRNEILEAFNQDEKFVLAIVFVNSDDSIEGPHYIRKPFQSEPDWGVASVNYNISELLKRATQTP